MKTGNGIKTGLYILFFILLPAFSLFASDFELFPEKRPGKTVVRDAVPLSPETSFSYGYSLERKEHVIQFGAGGKLPFFRYATDNGISLTGGGYGIISSVFEPVKNASNFIHADYKIGGFNELSAGNWVLELNIFHVSSHLGDDYIRLEGASVENVGYESAEVFASYRYTYEGVSAVFGCGYEGKFGRRPADLIFYRNSLYVSGQIETDFIPLRINAALEVFSFTDLPNIGIRGAMPLAGKKSKARNSVMPFHELFLAWYSGYSKQGFFYNRPARLLFGGFSMRL